MNEADANGRFGRPPSARGVLVLADPPEAGWRRLPAERQTAEPIVIEAGGGSRDVRLGAAAESPDATLSGPPRPTFGLLLGLLDLDAAEAAGVRLQGDPAALETVVHPSPGG
jgi:hypothetical protein